MKVVNDTPLDDNNPIEGNEKKDEVKTPEKGQSEGGNGSTPPVPKPGGDNIPDDDL